VFLSFRFLIASDSHRHAVVVTARRWDQKDDVSNRRNAVVVTARRWDQKDDVSNRRNAVVVTARRWDEKDDVSNIGIVRINGK
jgi:outer membrane cobalamin receptor